MQSIEIQARSLEEAKTAAAAKLGVPESDVSVTLIEQTKGLFGKSSVRVRAEVADAKPAKAEKAEKPTKAEKAKPAAKKTAKAKAEPEEKAEETPAKAKPAAKRTTKKAAEAQEPEAEASEAAETGDVQATKDDGNQFLDLLKTLLASSDLDIDVKLGEISGRYVNVVLDGKDTAYLVGKNGEVLNTLQYLLNVVGGRRFRNGVRVTLDGNDYRHRREQALTQLAVEIASQVSERGEEAVLDALPAFERRIIHKALVSHQGVTTYSEGEEPNRRVIIAPAD